MRLAGRSALVTGGGSGIGRGIALAFARDGCRVAIAGRREDALRETASLWRGEPSILWRAGDVADRASAGALCSWAAEALGALDILVNSAGINIPRRALAVLEPEDWERVLAVNATGAFLCMRAVLPGMRARRDGLIINISSVAGKRAALLGGVAYNASKFAMTALGATAAIEEARNGIRVTNIFPGEVDTPILERRPTPVSPEHRARMLQPEDVAAAALMVALLPPRAHVPELIIKPLAQDYA
jgi:NAD(P)-dependent dehydrogenase (short-subunit alcohol dehydrogenase family)